MNNKPPASVDTYRLWDVSKNFGDRHALGPVTLEFPGGEKTAIIGPSGAGKTTLLRLIAGEITPSQGTIELRGANLESIDRTRRYREVGFMHQQLDLVPQLSARKNIEAGNSGRWSIFRTIASLILPVADVRSEQIGKFLGLEGHLDERTSRLSGGQQQRVALARLLVQAPALYLADEPASSLDPGLTDIALQTLCGVLLDKETAGSTVIANIHSPELATRHFDRVIGLNRGVVVFDKPANQVTQTDTAYVYDGEDTDSSGTNGTAEPAFNWGRD